MSTPFGTAVLTRWLQIDPATAAAWLAAHPFTTEEQNWQIGQMLEMSRPTLDMACDHLPDGAVKQTLLKAAAMLQADHDPDRAFELAQQMSPGQAQTNMCETIAYSWAAVDANEATKWLLRVEDPILRGRLLIVGAKALATSDPDLAASWLSAAAKDGAPTDDTALVIAESWAARNAPAAATWVAGLADPVVRTRAMETVIKRWMALQCARGERVGRETAGRKKRARQSSARRRRSRHTEGVAGGEAIRSFLSSVRPCRRIEGCAASRQRWVYATHDSTLFPRAATTRCSPLSSHCPPATPRTTFHVGSRVAAERCTGLIQSTQKERSYMNLLPPKVWKKLSFAVLIFACGAGLPNVHALEKGADISYAQQMEVAGYKWKTKSGTQEDIMKICHDMGMNVIRLRTWVHPSSSPTSGHCSQSETIAMAKRVYAAGMAVYIDFHYGDTWNSVGTQNPPAAWANYTYSQMKTAIYDYTYNFLVALKNAGVTPTYCSPGNEVNSGICHPVGSISNPAQMTGCIMAGYDAIKAVFPNCKVIIHVAQIQNSGATAMLDAYKSNGGKWDVTGFSCYATGSLVSSLINDAKALQSRYGKPIFQVEFGESESNPTGTKTDLQSYFTAMKNLGSNGVGVLYWEPEVYPAFNSNDTKGAWNQTTEEPTAGLDPMSTN